MNVHRRFPLSSNALRSSCLMFELTGLVLIWQPWAALGVTVSNRRIDAGCVTGSVQTDMYRGRWEQRTSRWWLGCHATEKEQHRIRVYKMFRMCAHRYRPGTGLQCKV